MTIHDLRQAGNKVRVSRERYVILEDRAVLLPLYAIRQNNLQTRITINGGKTTLWVTKPDGKNVISVAECSISDQFKNRVGLEIAIARLEKVL